MIWDWNSRVMSWARDRLVTGVPLTQIPYLVASSGLSIALWQVKDMHSSYLWPCSSMTHPESQTQVMNVLALQGVQYEE